MLHSLYKMLLDWIAKQFLHTLVYDTKANIQYRSSFDSVKNYTLWIYLNLNTAVNTLSCRLASIEKYSECWTLLAPPPYTIFIWLPCTFVRTFVNFYVLHSSHNSCIYIYYTGTHEKVSFKKNGNFPKNIRYEFLLLKFCYLYFTHFLVTESYTKIPSYATLVLDYPMLMA